MDPRERILIVEDEPAARQALETLLREDGWEVSTARDGREAIAALERGGIAAVVTDLVMPGTDGFVLLEWIRAREPGLPVVVVSGFADTARRSAIGDLERVRWIPKPLRYDDLAGWLAATVGPSPG